MSEPVPRHLRNPRRAYDEHGREIAPPTIAALRTDGHTTAAVFCRNEVCRRHAIVGTDRFPDDLPFPDIALRAVCSACGSRDVQVQIDIGAMYARHEVERKRRDGPMVRWPEDS